MSQDSNKSESFIEFLNARAAEKEQSGPEGMKNELVANNVPANIATQLALGYPSFKKSDSVANKLVDISASPEFLEQFSDELGAPLEGESRDEFIARGKNLMRNQLRAALDKKGQ